MLMWFLRPFYHTMALPGDPEWASSKLRADIGLHRSTCDSLLETRANLNTNRLEDLSKTPVKISPPHFIVPVQMLKPLGGRGWDFFLFRTEWKPWFGQKVRLREWWVIWEARFTGTSPGKQFLFNLNNMPITESITHLVKVMVGCKREYRKFSYSSWNVFLLILWYSLCSTINSNSCLGLGCKV